MFDYTQAEHIDIEKFNSDFYFDYISMLKEFNERKELNKLTDNKQISIDYNINELPF
jgi:hypothetical protein